MRGSDHRSDILNQRNCDRGDSRAEKNRNICVHSQKMLSMVSRPPTTDDANDLICRREMSPGLLRLQSRDARSAHKVHVYVLD